MFSRSSKQSNEAGGISLNQPIAEAPSSDVKALDPMVQQAIDRLSDSDPKIRKQSAKSLGSMGSVGVDGVSALIERLEDPSWIVRQAVVVALGELAHHMKIRDSGLTGGVTESTVKALTRQVVDEDPGVVVLACGALKAFGTAARSSAQMLDYVARHNDYARDYAIDALYAVTGRSQF